MENNKFFSVIVNAVVTKEGKVLLSQRSFEESYEPGKWTIPGGKVENPINEKDNINIIEKTLAKEVKAAVGVDITENVVLISNNSFKKENGQTELSLVFLCEYKEGKAVPLENKINVAWVKSSELENFNFPQNIKSYIEKGFNLLNI